MVENIFVKIVSIFFQCENALQKKHHQTSTSVPNRSHNETVKEHSSDLAKYFNSTKPLLENSGICFSRAFSSPNNAFVVFMPITLALKKQVNKRNKSLHCTADGPSGRDAESAER